MITSSGQLSTFPTLMLTRLLAMAGAAISMTSARLDVGILRGVLMPLSAPFLRGLKNGSMSTGLHRIANILLRTTPIQILQGVVVWVIITMTTMSALWSRTNKGHEHDSMNKHRLALSVAKEGCAPVAPARATASDQILGQLFPFQYLGSAPSTLHFTVERSHTTVIRNLIPWIIRHRCPSFFSHTSTVAHSARLLLFKDVSNEGISLCP
jgi:hypothetical protein